MVAPTSVSKAKLAVNSLRDAEGAALESSDSNDNNSGGFYTGSGKNDSGAKNGKFNKTRKRIATLGLIASLLIGGGTFWELQIPYLWVLLRTSLLQRIRKMVHQMSVCHI